MKPLVMMMSASLTALALAGGAWAGDSHRLEPAWIGAAKTSADHEAVAKAYDAEALGFEKKAAMHRNLAETYGATGLKAPQAAQAKHCESVAASLTTAACTYCWNASLPKISPQKGTKVGKPKFA